MTFEEQKRERDEAISSFVAQLDQWELAQWKIINRRKISFAEKVALVGKGEFTYKDGKWLR